MIVRMLHPPRTGGVSIKVAWDLGPPEWLKHRGPTPADFSYGFTRNPFDRVVSIYHRTRHCPDVPFRDWALMTRDRPMPESERLKPIDWLRPCAWWLMGATFVGRFEQREKHLRILADALHRPYPGNHEGATEREPYQAYHDAETRAWVEQEYAADIALYGYRFEPLAVSVPVLEDVA